MTIIKSNTPNETAPSIVVRYTLDGVYAQANDITGAGVEIPDDAEIIDIAFYGSQDMTQQVVFLPAWPA